MTVEALKTFGANTAEGLTRCMNNEAFYLRLVSMALADKNFGALQTAMEAGDASGAFEAAHGLKGSLGNLALTPLFDPASALTEILRGRTDIPGEAKALFRQMMDAREKALAL